MAVCLSFKFLFAMIDCVMCYCLYLWLACGDTRFQIEKRRSHVFYWEDGITFLNENHVSLFLPSYGFCNRKKYSSRFSSNRPMSFLLMVFKEALYLFQWYFHFFNYLFHCLEIYWHQVSLPRELWGVVMMKRGNGIFSLFVMLDGFDDSNQLSRCVNTRIQSIVFFLHALFFNVISIVVNIISNTIVIITIRSP